MKKNNKVTTSALMKSIATDNTDVNTKDLLKYYNLIIGGIKKNLSEGKEVELRGIGILHIMTHKGHPVQYSPKVPLKAYKVLRFRVSDSLRKKIRYAEHLSVTITND